MIIDLQMYKVSLEIKNHIKFRNRDTLWISIILIIIILFIIIHQIIVPSLDGLKNQHHEDV